MLLDIVPKTEGSFWLFVDKKWTIISSTNPSLSVGTSFQLESNFIKLKAWQSDSKIITIDWIKYIVWATSSSWYREYKVTDSYKNDVLCLIFMRIE